VLREHRRRQRQECDAAAGKWRDTGYVFTNRRGAPLHPGFLTHRIAALIAAAGLPPVRLHDLRHGAATLAHLAGTDLKTIQDQLGHSSIVLTADTYTSVLPAAQYKAAEATARLVLDAARRDRGKIATVARRTGLAAQRISEGIAARAGDRTANAAAHRQSTRELVRSSAAATVGQRRGNHRPHRTR